MDHQKDAKDNDGKAMDLHPQVSKDLPQDAPQEESPQEQGEDQAREPENRTPVVERLPLGTGYTAIKLPIAVQKPKVQLLEGNAHPGLEEVKFAEEPEQEPIPSPEDDFFDYDQDIFGDGTRFEP